MKLRQPIPHWNNFTVPELKQILEHCRALEELGIAQDEELMTSVSRDIALREKMASTRYIVTQTQRGKAVRKPAEHASQEQYLVAAQT